MKYLIIILMMLEISIAKTNYANEREFINKLIDQIDKQNNIIKIMEQENRFLRNQNRALRTMLEDNRKSLERVTNEYIQRTNAEEIKKKEKQAEQEKILKEKYKEFSIILSNVAIYGAIILAILIIFAMSKKIFRRRANNELAEY